MRRLTVLNVAYPFAPVGPDAVGGAEQVLSAIDEALVAAGHRSLVVACGGEAAGTLLRVPGVVGEIGDAARACVHAAVRDVLERTDADVVHLHGIDFASYLPERGPPTLVTLHLPLDWYGPLPERADLFLHGVSGHQCAGAAGLLPPITNGVDTDRLGVPGPIRRDFALVLGRVCPEKGQHLALLAARAAGLCAVLAGRVFPYAAHRDYFEREVRPLLDDRRRWIGPAGFMRKRRLLASARCVLVPSLAAETSSLVAMEAAACGTPVIAFRSGALPETVVDGRTGFIVDGVPAMAEAIGRAGAIDPAVCRAHARARFSRRRMTDAYLDRYGLLAA